MMGAPFQFTDISARAERLADQLLSEDSYGDRWADPPIGELQRVYALLTHRPNDAFDEPVTREYLAECRMYAAIFLSAIYDALAPASTCDDVLMDLLTEYDSLVDAKLVEAMESAKSDAAKRIIEIRASGPRPRLRKPGSVRRIQGD
jgi:hypothetical protein